MQRPRKIKVPTDCSFCKERIEPKYMDVATISRYVSDRGRIIGRDRTGGCAYHQRRLAMEIKRARHLALMPFVAGL